MYNRQCHKAMKQAAVFPIEVQLTIQPSAHPTLEGEGEGECEEGDGDPGEKGKVVQKEPQEDLLIQTD